MRCAAVLVSAFLLVASAASSASAQQRKLFTDTLSFKNDDTRLACESFEISEIKEVGSWWTTLRMSPVSRTRFLDSLLWRVRAYLVQDRTRAFVQTKAVKECANAAAISATVLYESLDPQSLDYRYVKNKTEQLWKRDNEIRQQAQQTLQASASAEVRMQEADQLRDAAYSAMRAAGDEIFRYQPLRRLFQQNDFTEPQLDRIFGILRGSIDSDSATDEDRALFARAQPLLEMVSKAAPPAAKHFGKMNLSLYDYSFSRSHLVELKSVEGLLETSAIYAPSLFDRALGDQFSEKSPAIARSRSLLAGWIREAEAKSLEDDRAFDKHFKEAQAAVSKLPAELRELATRYLDALTAARAAREHWDAMRLLALQALEAPSTIPWASIWL